MVITGGDRTPQMVSNLQAQGVNAANYNRTQHGAPQGYRAADVQYYQNGQQIDVDTVRNTALEHSNVGGVGTYDTFNHIDTRERVNGHQAQWDDRDD